MAWFDSHDVAPCLRLLSVNVAWVAVAITLALAAGCGGGGGGNTPTSPTSAGGTSGGTTAPMTATITISATGVSPSAVTIARGGRITVVNNNNRTHELSSDPHPNHTDCPEVNDLGALSPGQSGMTAAFPAARRCGFHDHLDHDNAALRGSITIQ